MVGVLPDSDVRQWSGEAALELATAAARDRLAALVLDLAPDASDLADRFGADPEPGFAQVMTGEVELSRIQHWDAARGAYYLPGGVRVLGDKVAQSRSVEALADRVRGQEGILFVLLDRHAAEAAAEAGWLDGVVRLGDADLGGPRMFGDVTALGHLERRQDSPSKPWERETTRTDGGSEPEPGDPTPEPTEPADPEPGMRPAASADREAGGAEEPEIAAAAGEPAETETPEAGPTLEVSEEAWEPSSAAGTEVMDRPSPPEAGEEPTDAEEDAEQPPVLQVSEAAWEARDAEEPGVDGEPEIETGGEDTEPDLAPDPDIVEEPVASAADGRTAELEADGEPIEPEVADGRPQEPTEEEIAGDDEPSEAEVTGEEESVEPSPEPVQAEVADDGEELRTDGETSGDEVEEEPSEPDTAPGEREVTGQPEPEIAGGTSEITDTDRDTGPEIAAESEEVGAVGEETESSDADEADAPEVSDDTDEVRAAEEAAGEEVGPEPDADRELEVDETPEADDAPEAEESDRPVGLEHFAELDEDASQPEADEEDEEDGDSTGETIVVDGEGPDQTTAPGDEPGHEVREPAGARVISSGLEVWPVEAREPVSAAEREERPQPDAPPESSKRGEPPESASVIAAALWGRPGNDAGSSGPEEPARDDYITPAMWSAGASRRNGGASDRPAEGGAVIRRGQWAPSWESDEPETADGERDEGRTEEPDDSGEPQRADFILDGLELPPEWSDEWEEEERAEADRAERAASAGTTDDGDDSVDFVTQGMGIPDEENDPWRSSSRTGEWDRKTASPPGRGRTASRPRTNRMDLPRRGEEQGRGWARVRKAAIVLFALAGIGAVGAAVLGDGPRNALADVASKVVAGLGDAGSSPPDGAGEIAMAGPSGSGAAVGAGVDSTRPAEPAAVNEEPASPSAASAPSGESGPAEVETPLASDAPEFYAVTDSLARSIERYGDQIELYRENAIGCPLLMSAREEADRLFVRLSMFRLSRGSRPDSAFRTTYGRFSEDMETVEQSYDQTQCPRVSTVPPRRAGMVEVRPPHLDVVGGEDSARPVVIDSSSSADTTGAGSVSDSLPASSPVDSTAAGPGR